MTILMGMAIYPPDSKPYVLMVADSMSQQCIFDINKESGEYEVVDSEIKEDVKKLHKFNNNLIIGFEGELRGDIHHNVIKSLSTAIKPDDDLIIIGSTVMELIKNNFVFSDMSNPQYSVLMAGFVDGIPSLRKIIFINNEIVDDIQLTPRKGTFIPAFDPQVTPGMVEDFRKKVSQYNPDNISLFRKALVNLAKETSKITIGSNDNIKVERLR